MIYRLYFHKRDGYDPVVWSLDEGDQSTEIHIRWFAIDPGVACYSAVNLAAKEGEPAGWVEILGARVAISNGGARFTPPLCGYSPAGAR